jgi:beta-galactosidase
VVLEPCFNWSQGDQSEGGGIRQAVIVSNCDHLKLYVKDALKFEIDPDRERYGHLPHPPFVKDLTGEHLEDWGDLRIDGYLKGEKVISKTLPGNDYDRQLHVEPDDKELAGDGIDATRVVLRVTNEHGGARPFSTGSILLRVEGPGEIIGENPFALVAGVGAIWIRSRQAAGVIRLHARHQYLGEQTVEIQVKPAEPELI